MNTVAFYDTKPCDQAYFERAAEADRLRCQFHEFRLTSETATSVALQILLSRVGWRRHVGQYLPQNLPVRA